MPAARKPKSMIRALKYCAAWLVFILDHTQFAAAHQYAKNSRYQPIRFLEKSELVAMAFIILAGISAALLAIKYIAS